MSITATVTNDTIKLPEGVHFPDGTTVRIEQVTGEQEPAKKTFGERYKKYVGIMKDGPVDLAENHDHYLYGTPKRNP